MCVIVYYLLGLCGSGETRKGEEMARNGGPIATEATVTRSEDEEQRKELYPDTVSILRLILPGESNPSRMNNEEIANCEYPRSCA